MSMGDKTSQTSAAVDQLERDASLKTEEAVRQGRQDVRDMQAAGAEYLHSTIETAKVSFGFLVLWGWWPGNSRWLKDSLGLRSTLRRVLVVVVVG
jgi:hypothetical protein